MTEFHSIVSYSHTVFLVVNLGQAYFYVIIYRLCLYTKSVPIGPCLRVVTGYV